MTAKIVGVAVFTKENSAFHWLTSGLARKATADRQRYRNHANAKQKGHRFHDINTLRKLRSGRYRDPQFLTNLLRTKLTDSGIINAAKFSNSWWLSETRCSILQYGSELDKIVVRGLRNSPHKALHIALSPTEACIALLASKYVEKKRKKSRLFSHRYCKVDVIE